MLYGAKEIISGFLIGAGFYCGVFFRAKGDTGKLGVRLRSGSIPANETLAVGKKSDIM